MVNILVTHTVCLKFSSPKSLNRQLQIFCDVVPEVMMEPASFLLTDPDTLILEAKVFDSSGASAFLLSDTKIERSDGPKSYFDVFFQTLGFSHEQAEKIKKIDQKTIPLWSLLPFTSIKNRPDTHYLLVSAKYFETVTKLCFDAGLYNFSYLQFNYKNDHQVMFKIPGAPLFLLLKFEEEIGACSFWKDEFDLFYPRGKIHPMSRWWSSKLGPGIILDTETIGLESIEFQPILNAVEFQFPEVIREEIDDEALPEVHIHLELKTHHTRNPDRVELWYFYQEDLKVLENWIYHLSSVQHRSYIIFALEGPIKGYILKLNGIRKAGTPSASPLPNARFEFYKPFPAEEIYLPVGKSLFPKLPMEKIFELLPFKRDEGLIFFPQPESFLPLRIPLRSFQPLENLVLYILEESSNIESRSTQLLQFFDPSVLIAEMEQEAILMDTQARQDVFTPFEDEDSTSIEVELSEDQFDELAPDEEVDHDDELLFTERFLIDQNRAQMVTELRQWIVENPTSQNPEPFKRLGILEMMGQNHLEGLYLLSMALTLSPNCAQQKQIIRAILNCQLQGEGIRGKLKELSAIPIEAMTTENISILSFHTIKESEKLSYSELRNFLTNYLPLLEENHYRIPPILYWNIALGLHECLQPGTYFLYRARDHILFRLLTDELLPPVYLSGLLSATKKEITTGRGLIDDIYEDVLSAQIDEADSKVKDKLVLHLVFATGYALDKNSERCQEELEIAWKIISSSAHPFHKILYETYSFRSQEILEGRESQASQFVLKDATSYSPAHIYFHDTLVKNSLLLGKASESFFAAFDVPGFQNRSRAELLNSVIPRTLETILRNTNRNQYHAISRAQSFHAILNVLPTIGESQVFKLFEDLHSKLIPTFSPSERAGLLSRMILLASQFSRLEWVHTLSPDLLKCMEDLILTNPNNLSQILEAIMELLPRMDDPSTGLTIFNFMQHNQAMVEQNPRLLVIFTRLMDLYGDSKSIESYIDQVLDYYFKTSQPAKFDLLVCMVSNWRKLSQELQSSIREKMVANLGQFRDHLSLNEAFSISKLLVYEFLVLIPSDSTALSAEARSLLYALEHTWKQRLAKTFEQAKEETL